MPQIVEVVAELELRLLHAGGVGGAHISPAAQPGRHPVPLAVVRAVSLNEAGHPIHMKISPVSGFTSEGIGLWAQRSLRTDCAVLSDGLACFRSVIAACCEHTFIVTSDCHPNDLPEFRLFADNEVVRRFASIKRYPDELTSGNTPSSCRICTRSEGVRKPRPVAVQVF